MLRALGSHKKRCLEADIMYLFSVNKVSKDLKKTSKVSPWFQVGYISDGGISDGSMSMSGSERQQQGRLPQVFVLNFL